MCLLEKPKLKKKWYTIPTERINPLLHTFINILNMNELQTTYLTKIYSGAIVLREFCKKLF